MNIAHIESSINWGGQELRVIEQSEWLIAQGHNIWIIARENSMILKEAKKRNIPYYALDLRGSVNPATIWNLLRFVRQNKIDILDSHSSRDASYAMYVHLLTKTKVIRSRHVTDRIKSDFFHALIWKYGNTHIITTADNIKQQLVHTGLAKPEKIDVALAGVDIERFDYRLQAEELKKHLNIPNDHIVVSNIGMIRKDKGQLFYVKACKKIAEKMDKVTFLQVGDATASTQAYKEEVLETGRELMENGRLKFVGYKDDVENYMAASDIVIVASIATEAQTRLVSQAFLMKKNVIATNVGGLPEMIEDGKTGILCEPKSADSIADAFFELVSDEEKRVAIRENAYHHALNYMTMDQMMKQMVGIYTKVLQRS